MCGSARRAVWGGWQRGAGGRTGKVESELSYKGFFVAANWSVSFACLLFSLVPAKQGPSRPGPCFLQPFMGKAGSLQICLDVALGQRL